MADSIAIGGYTITAFRDGRLQTTIEGAGASDTAVIRAFTGSENPEPVIFAVNTFLIEGRGICALVDTGCGNTRGPGLGKLTTNLIAAGKPLAAITHVLLTHFHPDHSNGLIDGAGAAVFPNAELIAHETEARFWLDTEPSQSSNERIQRNRQAAQQVCAPYQKRMRRVQDGEALPGILARVSPGHTPGHSCWIVEDDGDSLMIWGDTIHLTRLQLAHPEIGFNVDVDPAMGAASRMRLLDQVSADRTRVAGMHLEFPGFAYIVKRGGKYELAAE